MKGGAAPIVALGCGLLGLGLGALHFATTALDDFALPVPGVMALSALLLVVSVWRRHGWVDPTLIVSIGLCFIGASLLGGVPPFFAVLGLKAIIHHSLLAGLVLLVVGVPLVSAAVFYLRGATPSAEDAARYPLVLLPVILVLGVYAVMIANVVLRGLQQLNGPVPVAIRGPADAGGPGWLALERAYVNPFTPPFLVQAGFLNHLLGTGLLVVMTLAFAGSIGVGVGVFVAEVSHGRVGRVVHFTTTALRGISVFLLATAGVTLVAAARDTPFGALIAGYSVDPNGEIRLGRGSFLTAAVITSLLIIPVVAHAAQQGCRSLPRGLREGSAALGATPDYTLLHLTLPWGVPNIVTSLLIGAAEAAGGVATLLFIGGTGENGVGPFAEATSLAYAIFLAQYSPDKPFRDMHQPLQFAAAAILLAMALGLTVLALLLKRRYAVRYQA